MSLQMPTTYPPQYGYRVPPPAQPGTNGLALVSLIFGVKAIFLPGVGILAAVMGHKARKQIRRTGETGSGFATAGIVLGWVGTGLWTAFIALEVVVAVLTS